jgi:hypothetical protein
MVYEVVRFIVAVAAIGAALVAGAPSATAGGA